MKALVLEKKGDPALRDIDINESAGPDNDPVVLEF